MRIVIILSIMIVAASGIAGSLSPSDLVAPCEVTFFDMYLDGGTLGGKLQASDGRILEFCRDGRLRMFEPDQEPPSSEPWLFWVGATHPDHEGARPLALGSAEETVLMALLQAWVDELIGGQEFAEARSRYEARSTVPVLNEIVAEYGLDDAQKRALRVHDMLRRHALQPDDS